MKSKNTKPKRNANIELRQLFTIVKNFLELEVKQYYAQMVSSDNGDLMAIQTSRKKHNMPHLVTEINKMFDRSSFNAAIIITGVSEIESDDSIVYAFYFEILDLNKLNFPLYLAVHSTHCYKVNSLGRRDVIRASAGTFAEAEISELDGDLALQQIKTGGVTLTDLKHFEEVLIQTEAKLFGKIRNNKKAA